MAKIFWRVEALVGSAHFSATIQLTADADLDMSVSSHEDDAEVRGRPPEQPSWHRAERKK
jgi:hypothetical protein